MTEQLLLSISAILCFASLMRADTVTTISGSCIMDDGAYVQTWSYDVTGTSANPGYTCNDPSVPDSTVVFAGFAMSSISPEGAAVSDEVYSNLGSLPCKSELCHVWTTLTETVTIQEQETFVATGGVGKGVIEGECISGVYGGAAGSGDTSFGGSGCPAAPVPFSSTPVAFAFGQPFTLFTQATSTTSGDGFPNDMEWDLTALTTEIVDANGNPIHGVVFTAVPEPSTLLLLGGGFLGFAVWRRRRAHL